VERKAEVLKNSEPYSGIAEAYDYILRHVDYEQWYQFIKGLMTLYVENPETVLELGCGTGKFGAKFSADNYRIFGIDISLNMLRVAKTRAFRSFRIICADIRNFYLKRKFDFIFSVHDTMNYQITIDDVRSVLRCVKRIMHEKSIFMFDITTEHNIDRFFDNKTSFYKTRGMNIEWSNSYDRKKKHIISTFIIHYKDGRDYKEEHIQRIYSREEMEIILDEEGFDIVEICSDYTYNAPSSETIMINFIVKSRAA
jgi:ubiquinone/menaquinone biosynthesis C-methylase UbiE